MIVIAGTGREGWNVRDELEEEESESVISGRGNISGDSASAEREGAVEALVPRRAFASGDSDKKRGEFGMSSSMKSGFSEGTTIWDLNARGLRVRVIRCCRKGRVNLQNLVRIPRSIRGATSSRTKVPAPTLVIIAVIVRIIEEGIIEKGKGGSSDDGLLDMSGSGSGPTQLIQLSLNTRDSITRDRVIPQRNPSRGKPHKYLFTQPCLWRRQYSSLPAHRWHVFRAFSAELYHLIRTAIMSTMVQRMRRRTRRKV